MNMKDVSEVSGVGEGTDQASEGLKLMAMPFMQ